MPVSTLPEQGSFTASIPSRLFAASAPWPQASTQAFHAEFSHRSAVIRAVLLPVFFMPGLLPARPPPAGRPPAPSRWRRCAREA